MAVCGAKAPVEEAKNDFEIGDVVMTEDKKPKMGYVKFVGENKYTKEFWGAGICVGVFLSEKRGQMDGTYKNEKFFRCPAGYGLMLKASKWKKVEDVKDDFKNADIYKEWAEKLDKEAKSEEAVASAKKAAAAITALFKQMDGDGGGDLSKDEFVKALGEKGVEACDAKDMFKSIDATNSGSVSLAEFKSYIGKAAEDPKLIPEKIRTLLQG